MAKPQNSKETLRDKASQAANEPKAKRRVIRKTANQVSRPVRSLAVVAKPLKAKPLQTPFRLIGRILWPKFLRNAWGELRQVQWPNRKETFKLTMAVFIFAVVFGVVIAITDFGLDRLFKKLLL